MVSFFLRPKGFALTRFLRGEKTSQKKRKKIIEHIIQYTIYCPLYKCVASFNREETGSNWIGGAQINECRTTY